jgi:exodeoxyribonuclease VII large subunit
MSEQARPEGIPGVGFEGPFAVGTYAKFLQGRMRQVARVQIFGEVFNLRVGRGAKVYFELRDGDGAVPCSMWRTDFDKLGPAVDAIVDGAQIVVAGGPDYYPGSRTSSPSFSFQVTGVRVAGEGDLLAQLDRLRKALAAEGLFEPQKALHRPVLPRTIGVVTGEGGKARDDVLAGLRRRGWGGRVVWAFAPVQDRHAAPRITQALQDLAAVDEVEVIVVARGGGSLADLFAFCDETLCRTVALLRVPVIASVGHHTDRTLIDDVAAVSCSTPTHAAESAVPLHCTEARADVARSAGALARHGRHAILARARTLVALSRAPAEHVARHRARLHQWLREIRAAGRRGCDRRRADIGTRAVVLERKVGAASGPDAAARRARLESLAAAIGAHDPQRVVARGYAMVEDRSGELVTTAEAARRARDVRLRFSDADVDATISEERYPRDRSADTGGRP